ncbi:hypothetical protein RUM44_007068 [Polyplax serrata]|uniref:Uncharacterized protein n=1 Tax=Polyplax serrata TaxID=468196 RepID=A0ABR1B1J3_POLSC
MVGCDDSKVRPDGVWSNLMPSANFGISRVERDGLPNVDYPTTLRARNQGYGDIKREEDEEIDRDASVHLLVLRLGYSSNKGREANRVDDDDDDDGGGGDDCDGNETISDFQRGPLEIKLLRRMVIGNRK